MIHDLNFEHHPEFIAPTPQILSKYFHQFAQYPERIVTVSSFQKMIFQIYMVLIKRRLT